MLVGSGKADTALTLCREIANRAPQVRLVAAAHAVHCFVLDVVDAAAAGNCTHSWQCGLFPTSHRSLRAPCPAQARWAHRRAGFLLAAAEKYEEGVSAFQSALKTDVRDAGEGEWA